LSLLERLIDGYGTGAVISVDSYMPDDSGEILRWILTIAGEDVPDVDVRVVEREGFIIFVLVSGVEELEVRRLSTKRYPAGARILETLGGIQRR
jgi:hypothetical protein